MPSGSPATLLAGMSANESLEYQRAVAGWTNTEIDTANEATTRKHDVALLAQ